MSLSKQLFILMTFIFLVIFSVNFILSINNIKSYLEVESETHVQNTVTSLGLSISPYINNMEDPIILTMMNAVFDSGSYKEIRLLDVDDKEIINLSNPTKMESVPEWLIDVVPMKIATATSEISSGWNISGKLYVTTNPAYAYLKLYQQGRKSLEYSILIFLVAMLLLILALRLTLKPLKEIEKQANAISAGNFTTLEKMPWTLEVKSVAQSMNSMSVKIGGMISRLNSKLEALSESLKRDPLTKLLNQASFNSFLKETLSSNQSGYAAFIKFNDLTSIAKEHGHKAVNTLLVDFASILTLSGHDKSTTSYRLYGSEFALIHTAQNEDEMTVLANTLKEKITALGEQYAIDDLVHIGIVRFSRSTDFKQIMPAMIEAYEQAKNIGSNAFFIKQDVVRSLSDLEWKDLIINTIKQQSFDITFKSEAYHYHENNSIKVMQEAFTVVKNKLGDEVPIGTFFYMAQGLNLEIDLDKIIVKKVIAIMESDAIDCPITINLSMSSVSSYEFQSWLRAQINNTNIKTSLLVFSITAYSAAKDMTLFAKFGQFVKSIGAMILLKRYASDIIPIEQLKDLQLDYLRLARDLTNGIQAEPNKAHFLELITEVGSLLEIKILAEEVSGDDFEMVKDSGIYGISR